MPHIKWPPATSKGKLTSLSKELLQLQEEMNAALEELLEVRASMDCHCWELDLGAELAVCLNDAQLTKAKACHAATTNTPQWAHLDSITALNHEAMSEEEQKCQTFMMKFSVALRACPLGDHWTLVYPLHLLTSSITLVPLLGLPTAA